jgi:hypothetical protein
VASHVVDGQVRYFMLDSDEGEIVEFATVLVPPSFGAEQAIKLGSNLIAAVGLNGHNRGRLGSSIEPAPAVSTSRAPLSAGDNRLVWTGLPALMAYARSHPGKAPWEIADAFGVSRKAVQSAVHRARAQRLIRADTHNGVWPLDQAGVPRAAGVAKPRRSSWEGTRYDWGVTLDDVVAYLREHGPSTAAEMAAALVTDNPDASAKARRQVISNRLMVLRQKLGKRLVQTGTRPLTRFSIAEAADSS